MAEERGSGHAAMSTGAAGNDAAADPKTKAVRRRNAISAAPPAKRRPRKTSRRAAAKSDSTPTSKSSNWGFPPDQRFKKILKMSPEAQRSLAESFAEAKARSCSKA